MALSNWDTVAFDAEGKPSVGVFEHPEHGAYLEIYKNWLYVHDPKGWQPGRQFTGSTIAEIQSGEVRLAGFEINAVRGPQSAVFVYACIWHWVNEKPDYLYFSGIGCYGFMDELDWIKEHQPEEFAKIDPKYLDEKNGYYCSSFGGNEDGSMSHGVTFMGWKDETEQEVDSKEYVFACPEPSLEDLWVGAQPETLAAFLVWLKKQNPKYAAKIKPEDAQRYNQGDAYFAGHFGNDIPVEKVGNPGKPILNEMLDKKKEG